MRKLDVLAEMAQGHANVDIARNLSLAMKAVDRYVTSLPQALQPLRRVM